MSRTTKTSAARASSGFIEKSPASKNPATSLKRRGFFCALDRIRTYDLLLRRQTLYPLSYEGNSGIPPMLAGRPRA
jgi:hypothetical protein